MLTTEVAVTSAATARALMTGVYRQAACGDLDCQGGEQSRAVVAARSHRVSVSRHDCVEYGGVLMQQQQELPFVLQQYAVMTGVYRQAD